MAKVDVVLLVDTTQEFMPTEEEVVVLVAMQQVLLWQEDQDPVHIHQY